MFRCFGDTLEHLITTCFGNAQEENHVIDKHSLQHKFKQNATAVASWNYLIRRAYSVVSAQINIKKSNLNCISTVLKSHHFRSAAAPIWSFFFFWCGAPAPLGTKVSRSRTFKTTPHPVELLWTRDQPVAETTPDSTLHSQETKHPCRRQDSKPQSQQESSHRSTPYTERHLGSVPKHTLVLKTFHIFNYLYIFFKQFQRWCTYCIKSGKAHEASTQISVIPNNKVQ